LRHCSASFYGIILRRPLVLFGSPGHAGGRHRHAAALGEKPIWSLESAIPHEQQATDLWSR
jgi:hypothetical protein